MFHALLTMKHEIALSILPPLAMRPLRFDLSLSTMKLPKRSSPTALLPLPPAPTFSQTRYGWLWRCVQIPRERRTGGGTRPIREE